MTAVFAAGGYRYIPAVFQYSGGVAAEPGFEITRIRFHRPVPLAEGFRLIEQAIRASGRPLTAFCACELRSPAPFTEDGFRAFNEIYAGTLRKWGVMTGDTNPVARSNVCPGDRSAGRTVVPRLLLYADPGGGRAHFRGRRQRRGARGQGQLSRPHGAPGRDLARRHAGEGTIRARRDGAAARRAWFQLVRHDRHAGLYRARSAPVSCRRNRAARRGACRASPGTTRARRYAAWNTRWTAAGS